MINEIMKYVLESLKLPLRYIIALGIVSAFLLFSPETILKKLSLYDLVQNYRPWVGIVLVFTSALIIVAMAIEITKWGKRWWSKRKFYGCVIEKLNSLTEDERQILRFYIEKQTKTNYLGMDDGIVQGLISAGILYRSAPVGNPLAYPHNINDFAWNYLNVCPDTLKGSTNTYRNDRESWRPRIL